MEAENQYESRISQPLRAKLDDERAKAVEKPPWIVVAAKLTNANLF